MLSTDQLEVVAFESRKAFEDQTIPTALLGNLYLEYNPDVGRIERFLRRAAETFPTYNCGLATVYLKHVYGGGEVVNGFYDGHDHTFLKLGGMAVDITADQFGGPRVYVGTLDLPWEDW